MARASENKTDAKRELNLKSRLFIFGCVIIQPEKVPPAGFGLLTKRLRLCDFSRV
jgi:hypothetical protein